MNDHEERRVAEAAQAIQKVNDLLKTPLVRDELVMKAKFRRAMYEGHITAGFTAPQALWLCVQPF